MTASSRRRPASSSLALVAAIFSAEWILGSGFAPHPLHPLASQRIPATHGVVYASEAVQAETAESVDTGSIDKSNKKKKGGPKQKQKKGMKMTLTIDGQTNGEQSSSGKKRGSGGGRKKSGKGKGKGKGRPRSFNKNRKGKPKPLKPLSDLVLGTRIDGVVAGISDFGAFVKTQYAIKQKDDPRKGSGYALLHKSQISDDIVENVSDALRVGDRIQNARVINVNYARGEVGLSLRKQRPGRRPLSDITVGDELDGKVNTVTSYGAFIDIGAKKNALLHISRITQDKVTNIRDYLNEGDWVTVRIIEKDDDKQTLACSMLDRNADEYITKRQRRLNKKRNNHASGGGEGGAEGGKTELEFFEEAIKELEQAFK